MSITGRREIKCKRRRLNVQLKNIPDVFPPRFSSVNRRKFSGKTDAVALCDGIGKAFIGGKSI